MAADKSNITLREIIRRPLTHKQADANFKELIETIDELHQFKTSQAATNQSVQSQLDSTTGLSVQTTYVASAGTSLEIDTDGIVDLTLTQPVCALSIPIPALDSGIATTLTLIIRQGTGSNTITWPSSIRWVGNREPVLTYEAGSFDTVNLVSQKVGTTTTWIGYYTGGWHNA